MSAGTRELAAVQCAVCAVVASTGLGSVTSYDSFAAWSAASPPYTTLDFIGLPDGIITEAYTSVGATFTEGNDWAWNSGVFALDGWGLLPSFFGTGTITIQFSAPITSIAAHYGGWITADLYSGDTLVGTAFSGSLGPAEFVGGTSTEPFDRVVLAPFQSSGFYLDNLYFTTIPAPPTVGLVAVVFFGSRRRRSPGA